MRSSALSAIALVALGGSACSSDDASTMDTHTDAAAAHADGGDSATGADVSSRCAVTPELVVCAHESISLSDSLSNRTVVYETPLGTPPQTGWPVVVYYQGSFIPGHGVFEARVSGAFGVYQLALTVKALLDGGYAVISPDAFADGSTYWETNIPPYAEAWSGSPDDTLMHNLFAAIADGSFGPLDSTHLYAMGLSSGGFMTSRMAVSYPGKFRALADCSGSYATCSTACSVPPTLPSDHPPTIFLHGALDTIVPTSSVQPYLDELIAEGHEVKLVSNPTAGHEWLVEGPTEIPAWFDAHH